jgi:hypothetical protein
VSGDIQVPSTLPLKLPCELALGGELSLGGEPLEASRSSQEGLIARLERLLQRMGTPVMRQRPDADGQAGCPHPGGSRPGALAGGARRPPAAAAPATVSGALTSGRPEPNQIMLEFSEDQNLDHNSGARQHLLALEQLGFTLAMDDDGIGYSGLQRHHTSPELGCRLGQGILLSKPFQAEQLDHLA